MPNPKKRILITGGLGHIGSCLIRDISPELVGSITIVDNLESQRFCSLFDLPKTMQYQFIEADVRTVDFAPLLNDVDIVIHLAAIANPELSFLKPEEAESVNLEGLKRVARACAETGVALLFPSSTSVYGGTADRVNETSTAIAPQSPYAESKLAAEQFLAELGTQGLRYTICRFGTIFGPSVGMRFHTAVNKFIWQALTRQPITVWKTAWQQQRPYLDVRDAVAAIAHCIAHDLFANEIYNVVTGTYTVEQIVDAIRSHVTTLEVSFVDSPIMNELSYKVDCTKLTATGFSFQGNLEQGITATFAQFGGITTNH